MATDGDETGADGCIPVQGDPIDEQFGRGWLHGVCAGLSAALTALNPGREVGQAARAYLTAQGNWALRCESGELTRQLYDGCLELAYRVAAGGNPDLVEHFRRNDAAERDGAA